MNEEWKDVPEYPDLFMISNYGRVWSKRSNKILKQGTNKNGYKVISSKIGGRKGKSICKKVHRWVAEAFIDNPDDKPFVNHKDGNKTNNNETNLEWCTSKENIVHAYQTGLIVSLKGEYNHNSKLTEDDVRYIKRNYSPGCRMNGQRAMARRFNVRHSTIQRVLTGEIWSHVE